jgi:phosphate transport system substrate-binding protein
MWLLFYKKNPDPKKAGALRELVDYCLTEGQKTSAQMGYIALPESVAGAVRRAVASLQ